MPSRILATGEADAPVLTAERKDAAWGKETSTEKGPRDKGAGLPETTGEGEVAFLAPRSRAGWIRRPLWERFSGVRH